MDEKTFDGLLDSYLFEDLGSGDVSTNLISERNITAIITANSTGFIYGVKIIRLFMKKHGLKSKFYIKDGELLKKGFIVAKIFGSAKKILIMERVILNLLSVLSGVTTETKKYSDLLLKCGSKAKITATRKTHPGLRFLEKEAVKAGGGNPHRYGLYDMIMLKDNHLKMLGLDIAKAVSLAKKSSKKLKIEVEVSTPKAALNAAKAGADIVMLDNMTPANMRKAIELIVQASLRRKLLIEASGNISLKTIPKISKLDLDWISTSKITLDITPFDFGLDFN